MLSGTAYVGCIYGVVIIGRSNAPRASSAKYPPPIIHPGGPPKVAKAPIPISSPDFATPA